MNKLQKIVVIGPESTGKSTLCQLLAAHYGTLWCPEYAREYLLTHGVHYTYDDLLTIAKGQVALEEEYAGEMSKVKSEKSERETTNVKREMGETSKVHSPVPSPLTINYKPSQSNPIEQTTNSAQSAICNLQSTIKALFIDTDMYVMKVWSEYVFHKCHPYILEQIATRKYDLYLLCDIDLPWEEDILREYPDKERRQELYNIYKNLLMNQSTPWVEISGGYEERMTKAVNAVDYLFDK